MAKDTGTLYKEGHKEGNIKTSERMLRAFVAIVMLAYPMAADVAPLDVLALLPLIAIYPMFTAIVGWDPIQFAKDVGEPNGRVISLSAVARIVLVAVGVMMIMTTLTYPGTFVGWYSLLALFAIVPIMVAILAENPVQILHESRFALSDTCKTNAEQPVINEADLELVENAVDISVEEKHQKAA